MSFRGYWFGPLIKIPIAFTKKWINGDFEFAATRASGVVRFPFLGRT